MLKQFNGFLFPSVSDYLGVGSDRKGRIEGMQGYRSGSIGLRVLYRGNDCSTEWPVLAAYVNRKHIIRIAWTRLPLNAITRGVAGPASIIAAILLPKSTCSKPDMIGF